MLPIHQQRIRETFYALGRIQPEELAPALASFYTTYSFTVARQQLQRLADTLSVLSVAVSGFVLDSDWQRREDEAVTSQREAARKATGPDGEKLLSVKEVAALLGVNRQKVYSLIKTGKLRAKDINEGEGKSLLRIRASDVA